MGNCRRRVDRKRGRGELSRRRKSKRTFSFRCETESQRRECLMLKSGNGGEKNQAGGGE